MIRLAAPNSFQRLLVILTFHIHSTKVAGDPDQLNSMSCEELPTAVIAFRVQPLAVPLLKMNRAEILTYIYTIQAS